MAKSVLDAMEQQRDPQTYAIIGAAMEVHRELGRGFLEAAYQDAMRIETTGRGIPFVREMRLAIRYKGQDLDCEYRADFVCYETIIVEIKAIAQITPVERAQVINYLKATGFKVALLINYGADSLQFERIVLNY